MAAAGYPDSPRSGDRITGVEDAGRHDGVTVFHAGTATAPRGDLVTSGGRVLGVTALGTDIGEARARAYAAVGDVSWPGARFRTDIALAAAGSFDADRLVASEPGDGAR